MEQPVNRKKEIILGIFVIALLTGFILFKLFGESAAKKHAEDLIREEVKQQQLARQDQLLETAIKQEMAEDIDRIAQEAIESYNKQQEK